MTTETFKAAQDWRIQWRVLVEGAIIEFHLSPADDDAREANIRGTLRFDGCMNLDTTGLHVCTRAQAESIGQVLGRVYEIAKGVLPHNDL